MTQKYLEEIHQLDEEVKLLRSRVTTLEEEQRHARMTIAAIIKSSGGEIFISDNTFVTLSPHATLESKRGFEDRGLWLTLREN